MRSKSLTVCNPKRNMQMKMTKTVIMILAVAMCFGAIASPRHPMAMHRPPIHRPPHRGLTTMCSVMIGATIGTVVANTLRPKVVVVPPQTYSIWVPEQRILSGYDQFGNPTYIIIPGHWETRTR